MTETGPEPRPPGTSILSTLDSVLRWAICLLGNAVGLTGVVLLAVVDRRRSHRLMHEVCAFNHRVFGLDVSLEDHNEDRYDEPPYVLLHLNQNSLVETFLFPWIAPRPYKVIINIEMALVPIFGWAQTLLGSRVIVRQWRAQATRQLARAVNDLRRGASYFISIEGYRSPDGRLQRYRKGPAVLAIESQATIIPFLLVGARRALPPGEWQIRPGPIRVVLLEPISTAGLTYDDRDALVARLRALAERELASRGALVEEGFEPAGGSVPSTA